MGFAPSAMQLKSSVFNQDGLIPSKYTGEGEDVSPALSWTGAPDGTKAFAIICHDPDAPLVSPNGTYGFVHWVLYNIPGDVNSLEEGTSQEQGLNLWDFLAKIEPQLIGMNRLVGRYKRD